MFFITQDSAIAGTIIFKSDRAQIRFEIDKVLSSSAGRGGEGLMESAGRTGEG